MDETLVLCSICQRGYPLREMEVHTWDGYMLLCPECHAKYHPECFCSEDDDADAPES